MFCKVHKFIIWTFISVFAVNLSTAQAESSDIDVDKVTHAINVYEAVVQFPAPIWFKSGKTLEQSEYYREQKGAQFVFEQIPKGQKFEDWKQLYAVHGDYIKLEKDIPLDAYISMSIQPFINVCDKKTFSLAKLPVAQPSVAYLLTCADSPNAPQGSGYGKGIGEIAIFHFAKVNNTFVKVYHEWRGKSFTPKDPATWPVKPVDIRTMVARIQRVKVMPSPKK